MSINYGQKDVLECFETPEGIYKLKSVLSSKCLPVISPSTRLSSVRLSFSDSRSVCCINSGRDIYIYPISGCRLYESRAPGKQTFKTSTPVCHDFGVSSLLLVGFTGGEIHLIDPFHKEFSKVYNEEKFIERTSVTCIRWVPYSTNQFLVAHASGHMYLYNEDLPCSPITPVYQLFKKGSAYVVYTCKTKYTCNPLYNWVLTTVPFDSGHSKVLDDCDVSTAALSSINQFAFSTCGKYLAVVTEDGYLRVFDYHRMQLYGFMRSYFGGLTCVDWSPDGKYVVVGGQDDLITIWSFTAQAVICRGQGHKSWTSVVRFDPFVYSPSMCCNGTTAESNPAPMNGTSHQHHHSPPSALESNSIFRTYRLGSVGQDTFLCLWELTEDVIRQGLRFSSRYYQSTGNSRQYHHPPVESLSISSSSACPDTLVDGFEKSRSATPSNAPSNNSGRRKPFFGSFRSPLPLTASRYHSEQSDTSGKSSILSDSGCLSLPGDRRPLNAVNGHALVTISSKDLLGTPNCPRLSDVPILEPFAKFGVTRDLITDLVFREDSINLAFQQGVILTYTRPQMDGCSGGSTGAAGDLSLFDTSTLMRDGEPLGTDDLDIECVDNVDVDDLPNGFDGVSPSSSSATTGTPSASTNLRHRHNISPGLQQRLSQNLRRDKPCDD